MHAQVSKPAYTVSEHKGTQPFYAYAVCVAPTLKAAAKAWADSGNIGAARACRHGFKFRIGGFHLDQMWEHKKTKRCIPCATITLIGRKKPSASTIAHECVHAALYVADFYQHGGDEKRRQFITIRSITAHSKHMEAWRRGRQNAKRAAYWNEEGVATFVGNLVYYVTMEVNKLWRKANRRTQ